MSLSKSKKKPQYSGGDAKLIKYIAETLIYPVDNEDELQTTVYVKFVIGKTGKVTKACIMRPLYSNAFTKFEKEVLRVIMEMPAWIPGEHKGKKVSVWFIVPVRINLK